MYYDFCAVNERLIKKLGFTPIDLKCNIISPKTVPEFNKLINKNKDSDFLVLENPNEKVLKTAVTNCAIDAVDGFVKYPMIKKMSERNIAILINFNRLLNARESQFTKILYLMQRTVRLAKKYSTPIVITSGANTKWELRSISDLMGFGESLGLPAGQAKKALYAFQEKILKRNKLKKAGKWVRPGIEVS